ncbi:MULTISPECIES: hypothetical protein [unclassified Corallococcus]|uniref:hypothetical protein n=1 Tax=unclassified Corallococcus TaxID=2685029 RepID=UPI001A90575D|nr:MULTISPECIES: hypothetical protein [unclassified Corallococcus]MBN9687442.1 hypothetical protein [Corallococcus sp. NCSPR001]WAS88735.1 hypothetical protein O0N60_17515 [Corallococcus sp. NCRR]
MQPERQVFGFIVRGAVGEERLFDGVGRALGLPPGGVARFDVDGPSDAAVLVETALRSKGFRTDVTLYVDASRTGGASGLTSLEVATRVAALLGEEVLVSPPADDPAVATSWFLVTPDGKRFRANEASPGHDEDEEDSVEIDRASLRPL